MVTATLRLARGADAAASRTSCTVPWRVAQSYGDGRYPAWMLFVALVLTLIAIGIVLLALMAANRPEGTLAVTTRAGGRADPRPA
jgi:hypothetical protein